jgi:hypothetical protein
MENLEILDETDKDAALEFAKSAMAWLKVMQTHNSIGYKILKNYVERRTAK